VEVQEVVATLVVVGEPRIRHQVEDQEVEDRATPQDQLSRTQQGLESIQVMLVMGIMQGVRD
jgi:hypothetical protein